MITDTIRVGREGSYYVSGVAIADGAVWVTSPTSMTLVRVDPTTGGIDERILLPFQPQDVIAAYGSIWVTIWT